MSKTILTRMLVAMAARRTQLSKMSPAKIREAIDSSTLQAIAEKERMRKNIRESSVEKLQPWLDADRLEITNKFYKKRPDILELIQKEIDLIQFEIDRKKSLEKKGKQPAT